MGKNKLYTFFNIYSRGKKYLERYGTLGLVFDRNGTERNDRFIVENGTERNDTENFGTSESLVLSMRHLRSKWLLQCTI